MFPTKSETHILALLRALVRNSAKLRGYYAYGRIIFAKAIRDTKAMDPIEHSINLIPGA